MNTLNVQNSKLNFIFNLSSRQAFCNHSDAIYASLIVKNLQNNKCFDMFHVFSFASPPKLVFCQLSLPLLPLMTSYWGKWPCENVRGLRKIPSFSLGPGTWKNFELLYRPP